MSSETLAGTSVTAHLPRVRTDLEFCAQADVGGVYGLTELHRDEVASAAMDSVQLGRLAAVMQQPEISLSVALNGPGAAATVYFSGLTHDYVTRNAERFT
jgi:hypothetical protein